MMKPFAQHEGDNLPLRLAFDDRFKVGMRKARKIRIIANHSIPSRKAIQDRGTVVLMTENVARISGKHSDNWWLLPVSYLNHP